MFPRPTLPLDPGGKAKEIILPFLVSDLGAISRVLPGILFFVVVANLNTSDAGCKCSRWVM